jgi:hypothetical protein
MGQESERWAERKRPRRAWSRKHSLKFGLRLRKGTTSESGRLMDGIQEGPIRGRMALMSAFTP